MSRAKVKHLRRHSSILPFRSLKENEWLPRPPGRERSSLCCLHAWDVGNKEGIYFLNTEIFWNLSSPPTGAEPIHSKNGKSWRRSRKQARVKKPGHWEHHSDSLFWTRLPLGERTDGWWKHRHSGCVLRWKVSEPCTASKENLHPSGGIPSEGQKINFKIASAIKLPGWSIPCPLQEVPSKAIH